jgi:hypothetical protein
MRLQLSRCATLLRQVWQQGSGEYFVADRQYGKDLTPETMVAALARFADNGQLLRAPQPPAPAEAPLRLQTHGCASAAHPLAL